jgi:hypothetical protein
VITSGRVTDVTSGYDVTSGSTEQQQQYLQSNDEESYYILKTNNPFFYGFFQNLYTVMHFTMYVI